MQEIYLFIYYYYYYYYYTSAVEIPRVNNKQVIVILNDKITKL